MIGGTEGSERPVGNPADSLPTSAPVILMLVGSAVLASWVGTEMLAESYGDAPSLGRPVWVPSPQSVLGLRLGAALAVSVALALRVRNAQTRSWLSPTAAALVVGAAIALVMARGPVYAPTQGLAWMVRLRHYVAADSAERRPGARSSRTVSRPPVPPAIAAAAARARDAYVVGFGSAFLGFLTAGLAARAPRRRRPPSTSHGSARWGDGVELVAARGPWIGRAPHGAVSGQLLRYAGEGHALTVAPARSGKGVGAVIPNLLTYPGSVIVTDPKGENFVVTQATREQLLGQQIVALDPFAVVAVRTARFNPLSIITANSPDAIDDANLLADLLVVRGTGDDGHWDDEAHALLAGLIYYVATAAPPERRTLPHVRRLLTLRPDDFRTHVMDAMRDAGGLAERASARLEQKADRERSGVISSAQRHTHFLDSPAMEVVLGASDVDLSTLKTARVSLYLILPPHRFEAYRRWLRLMIGCALTTMWRTPGQPSERVLFLLDEFGHLGRMRPIEEAVALVPGYGLSFWFFLQDLSQLKSVYHERWPTFLANCEVLQAFGTNDIDTADYLSRRVGDQTIQVESESRSAGRSHGKTGSRSQSAGQGMSERSRRLLLPDEVLRLPSDRQLLIVKGRDPVLARRLNYLTDREFRDAAGRPLFASNPMHDRMATGPNAEAGGEITEILSRTAGSGVSTRVPRL